MVTLHKDKLVIELRDLRPKKKLKKLRKAITVITSATVVSDEMNYHAELPDAIAELIRMLGELNTNS
jgi:hypothetical protein